MEEVRQQSFGNPTFEVSSNESVIDKNEGGKLRRVKRYNNLQEVEIELEEELPPQDDNTAYLREGNAAGRVLLAFSSGLTEIFHNHPRVTKLCFVTLLHVIALGYLCWASVWWFTTGNQDGTLGVDFCNGIGMLYILYFLAYLGLFYRHIVKTIFGEIIYKFVLKPVSYYFELGWQYLAFRLTVFAIIIGSIVVFLMVDTAGERERLISVSGVFVLIFLGFLFSKHPGHIRWRPVFWGLGLQFIFGIISIRWTTGRAALQCIGDHVATFIGFTDDGTLMVYGDLLVNQASVFAFKILPQIIFFSFMVQMLYYLGVMQVVIFKLGWLLQVPMGTTVCESVNSSASIFLGPADTLMLLKPFIPILTASELHAVVTGTLATIAGTVMAAYMSFGVDPAHLITASVMSAPAALCYAKLFWPETEKSQTTTSEIQMPELERTNFLDAAAKGARDGISLILSIIANLIAFLAFMAFLNGVISWFFSLVGLPGVNFEIFIPLAVVMGVPWKDCPEVARLIGLKTVVNEFVAYQQLGEYISAGALQPRSQAIATYAVCGFANPGAVASIVGILTVIAPNKRPQVTSVVVRAFIASNAACFLTACVAGALIDSSRLPMATTAPVTNTTTSLNPPSFKTETN